MKPWTDLDKALTPDGQTITLSEHDGTYSIRVNGQELMSTRRHASEEKLAELACAHLETATRANVLVGGLGFGFTLKAALASLPADATVTVAELLGPVIEWNRNPAYPLSADALNDPRVNILNGDVFDLIRESRRRFDSIILDIDNGAAAFTTAENQQMYNQVGLQTIRAALKPNGCAAFWSAAADAPFEKTMRNTGFKLEAVRCRAHPTSGGWHTLYLGR